MRTLRIALCQLNPTVGDLEGNHAKIVAGIHKARERGVDLLAFPEMVVTGYPPEDLLLKPSFIEEAEETTQSIAGLTEGMTVVVGTVEREGDLYNSAIVFHDGTLSGSYRKRMLPNYGVFDENRYFMPGKTNPVFVRGKSVIGVNICEDIWYPGGPVEEQVLRGGAEIVLNISASPYHAGKAQQRKRMLCTRAADNQAVVCYVNLVGGQDGIIFDGGSLIVNEEGQILAEGEMFDEDFLVADLDLEEVFSARLHDPRLRKGRVFDDGEPSPRIPLPQRPTPVGRTAPTSDAGEGGLAVAAQPKPALEERPAPRQRDLTAEIYDALVFGTRDYVHKNGFGKVCIGMSGGADSSLTACIAVDALGADEVVGVSMPSVFTSDVSLEDAELLCNNLGMRLMEIPIRDVFTAYEKELAGPFEGHASDITEENLQARIRANYLMALSNKFDWMVLTTGNKSETSVGYSTLYGDTAGGFAVIRDVYKTMVYDLLRYRNTLGESPVCPERVLTRPPTAELRREQTDQQSLPPYDVLDPILRMYVEEDRSLREIVELGYEEAIVRQVIRLVDRAEYKRRQSPPGLKITPRAFGKDRRLPITNRWRAVPPSN